MSEQKGRADLQWFYKLCLERGIEPNYDDTEEEIKELDEKTKIKLDKLNLDGVDYATAIEILTENLRRCDLANNFIDYDTAINVFDILVSEGLISKKHNRY